MGISDAVKPVKTLNMDEMGKDFANQFAKVTWGTPGAEVDDKIEVSLQLKNALDDDLAAVERIRLTCTEGATMSLVAAGDGTVLAGDDSADMIIETAVGNGQFDLEVSFAGTDTITVVGGATQGSGFVACKEIADLVFA